MDKLWYTALLVSKPVYDEIPKNGKPRKVLTLEAGADLLAGPFATEGEAKRAVAGVRARLYQASRRTWFAEYSRDEIGIQAICLDRDRFEETRDRLAAEKRIPSKLLKHYDWPPPLAWDVPEYSPARMISEKSGRGFDEKAGDEND